MKQTIFPKTRTTRRLSKRVPLSGGGDGFTSVPDGEEEIFYRTEIDLGALAQMARDAAANRSQRSVDGALVVTVIERRRIGGAS